MTLLHIGVALWCLAHLFPAALSAQRNALHAKLGEKPYRGLFSLVILASLVLIVVGWRNTAPTPVYSPLLAPGPFISVLMLIALFLFFAAKTQGNVKRIIRHPQMTGVIVWGVAHLLVNGDSRSVALFGSLTVWAILEILLINRREGNRVRPGPAPAKADLIPLAIGTIVFAVLANFHALLFGVPAFPA